MAMARFDLPFANVNIVLVIGRKYATPLPETASADFNIFIFCMSRCYAFPKTGMTAVKRSNFFMLLTSIILETFTAFIKIYILGEPLI